MACAQPNGGRPAERSADTVRAISTRFGSGTSRPLLLEMGFKTPERQRLVAQKVMKIKALALWRFKAPRQTRRPVTCDEIVRALAEFRAIGATTAKAAADKSTATSTPDATYRKERVRAVLGSLVDPPGLDQWLNRERADLLARGRTLVQQVDAAWGAPLGEFERSLE